MQSGESGISRAGLAGSSCGHSCATTLLNILCEPREAKPRFRGEIFYASHRHAITLLNILLKPREAEPPLGGEAFYAA